MPHGLSLCHLWCFRAFRMTGGRSIYILHVVHVPPLYTCREFLSYVWDAAITRIDDDTVVITAKNNRTQRLTRDKILRRDGIVL